MDALQARLDALIGDARRATIPGAIGDDPDRAGLLFASSFDRSRTPTVPSASVLSVAIDGKGLFSLETAGGQRVYSRLGDFRVTDGVLVDGHGRPVLGFPFNGDRDRTSRVPAALSQIVVGNSTDITIASDGTVSGTHEGARRPLARLALAIFPSPDQLAREDETTARATTAAGSPRFVTAGSRNVGILRDHSLENASVALDQDLERIWRLAQQRDAQTAGEYAADQCDRDALGLVK